MNSAQHTDMTTAQAMRRLFEMWQTTTNHFAAQGLTGEALEATVTAFLIAKAAR